MLPTSGSPSTIPRAWRSSTRYCLIFGTLSIASSEIFASELTLEGEMRLFDKIEEVAVPVVHFDERPPRYQIQI